MIDFSKVVFPHHVSAKKEAKDVNGELCKYKTDANDNAVMFRTI